MVPVFQFVGCKPSVTFVGVSTLVHPAICYLHLYGISIKNCALKNLQILAQASIAKAIICWWFSRGKCSKNFYIHNYECLY